MGAASCLPGGREPTVREGSLRVGSRGPAEADATTTMLRKVRRVNAHQWSRLLETLNQSMEVHSTTAPVVAAPAASFGKGRGGASITTRPLWSATGISPLRASAQPRVRVAALRR